MKWIFFYWYGLNKSLYEMIHNLFQQYTWHIPADDSVFIDYKKSK